MNEMNKIRYKEAFLLMDENNKGVITVDDVHMLIRALGFTPTENDLEKIDLEFINNKNIDYLVVRCLRADTSAQNYFFCSLRVKFMNFAKFAKIN
jgi:hypothetical protein